MTFDTIYTVCVPIALLLIISVAILSIFTSKDKSSAFECFIAGLAFMFMIMLLVFQGYLSRQTFYYFGNTYVCTPIEEATK